MEDKKDAKKRVRQNEKKEKTTVEEYTKDDLTIEEVAKRAGISKRTLIRWLSIGLVPSPLWSKPGRKKKGFKHRHPNWHRFSKEYAEALRDCMVIKNSCCGYGTNSAIKELCYSRLLKFI